MSFDIELMKTNFILHSENRELKDKINVYETRLKNATDEIAELKRIIKSKDAKITRIKNKINSPYNGHFVYKYVYAGEVIYVGKTDENLEIRLSQHGKAGDNIPQEGWNEINNSIVYYSKLLSKHDTDIYESELIRRYKPRYNKAKTSEWSGVDLPELNWSVFNKN